MSKTQITHMNFGWLHAPPLPPASCHCLMIRRGSKIVLVDTGIGLHDIADPEGRIGLDAVTMMGFQFLPMVTAANQLAEQNILTEDVTDIVLTHCDADHAGGLSDFPNANVHVSLEEKRNLDSGNARYGVSQFAHEPHWKTYDKDDSEMFGLPTRKVHTELDVDIRLVPLFGHTLGHCGVAVLGDETWTLHVGDAYYLRDELSNEDHPIDELATMAADDNELRIDSLNRLRKLTRQTGIALDYFGYHDLNELPREIPLLDSLRRLTSSQD